MKLYLLICLVVSGLTIGWLPHGSVAADFPSPRVEYSADMTMTIQQEGGGQPYQINGKVYAAKGKERREVSNFGRKTIIIKTENETLTLMPEQRIYMKNTRSKSFKDPETMVKDGEVKITKDGTENINGQFTTRYKLEATEKGRQSFSGHAWFTKENIPVRFKGTANDRNVRQNMEINYYNIKVGKQNPKLFAAPGNYRLLPTGIGGMGGGPGNMSPEQIEKMKEMMRKQQN